MFISQDVTPLQIKLIPLHLFMLPDWLFYTSKFYIPAYGHGLFKASESFKPTDRIYLRKPRMLLYLQPVHIFLRKECDKSLLFMKRIHESLLKYFFCFN